MKRAILLSLLIFVILPLHSYSQEDYLPEGRNWCTGNYYAWSDTYGYDRKGICGDTLINDTIYKKLISINSYSYGSLTSLLRQESQKVWTRVNDEEFLMYDYSLEVGDTLEGTSMVVSEVLNISYNGLIRKTILFDGDNDYLLETWIEGLGSSAGFLHPRWDYYPPFDYDSWHCSANDWNVNLQFNFQDGEPCNCNANLNLFCQDPFNFTYESWNTTCAGTADGAAVFYNTNSCLWPDGVQSSNRTDLAADTYVVTVSDSLGIQSYVVINIEDPDLLTTSNDLITRERCDQFQNGSIEVNVTDGQAPYVYNWLGESSETNLLDSLSAGVFTLIVVDANDCADTMEYSVSLEDINVYARSEVDGENQDEIVQGEEVNLFAYIFGATEPISYQWIPEELINHPDSLSVLTTPDSTTTFALLVQDSLGCIGADSLIITVEIPDNILVLEEAVSIKIYPVPSKGKFTIESSPVLINSSLKVSNVYGENIDFSLEAFNRKHELTLNQPRGIYFVHFWYSNRYVTRKIIVD